MSKSDERMAMYDEQTRFSGVIYVLMLVVVVVFAGFVWNLYAGRDAPRIAAPPGAYKIEPPADARTAPDAAEERAMESAVAARGAEARETPAEEAPPPSGAPRLAPMPQFVSSGQFVAQVAALQSDAAAQTAWTRLASRAPDLFSSARLDVERADLGARGIYYRVRAGYFADRDNANRFCDRIKQMGQDCIAVQR